MSLTSPPPPLAHRALRAELGGGTGSWAKLFDIIGPVLALLGIFLLFYALIGSSFATFFNLQTILRQSTVTSMAALGATFIITPPGIDLSIGPAVALCAMVIATLMNIASRDPQHPDDP